jgi:general L-amino acid transport system substrate-binding protein
LAAAALLAATLPAFAQSGSQLKTIRDRGVFKCGVYENVPGLASLNAQGQWVGFDVDYCRAMAAAILGAPDKVEFVKMTFAQGIPGVKSGWPAWPSPTLSGARLSWASISSAPPSTPARHSW